VKVTKEKTENSQVFLSVEMEPDEVEESLKKSYRQLVKKTNIPGFRKGKAPRAILEHHVGKESLLEHALNDLIPQAYEKALEEQEIEAIAEPQIEVTQTDPVIFKATIPLKPTVNLGDYHQIKVTPEVVEIKEEDVDATIEQLRHQHATWETVERPVAFSDLVVFDIESGIGDEPFINQKAAQYQVVHEIPYPAPGFADQLSGMKTEEEKEFSLQFPADYPKDELAGKEAWFKVRVTEIKEEKLPELDDEFAKMVSPDCETVDSLREKILTNLKANADAKAKEDFEERVIEAVVDISQIEFPPILVEAEIDRLLREQSMRWQMNGRTMDDYLRSINKTGDELRAELRTPATKRITQSLALGKIVEEEKIEIDSSEIDAEIEKMITRSENKEGLQEFLNTPQSHSSVEQLLLTRKTVERLLEIAKSSGEE